MCRQPLGLTFDCVEKETNNKKVEMETQFQRFRRVLSFQEQWTRRGRPPMAVETEICHTVGSIKDRDAILMDESLFSKSLNSADRMSTLAGLVN